MTRVDYEVRFYVALKRIAAYMTPKQLGRQSEREYGLESSEALEMAYENMREEAKAALKGYRRKPPSGKDAQARILGVR